MSDWIDVNERLPEPGQDIWIRLSFGNGSLGNYTHPVRAADFFQDDHRQLLFRYGHSPDARNCWDRAQAVGNRARVRHWQPRTTCVPPSPYLPMTQPERDKEPAKGKRRYNMTPEGTAAKSAKMKEYSRKKREQQPNGKESA